MFINDFPKSYVGCVTWQWNKAKHLGLFLFILGAIDINKKVLSVGINVKNLKMILETSFSNKMMNKKNRYFNIAHLEILHYHKTRAYIHTHKIKQA